MEIIKEYKKLSKQGKLNVQCAIALTLVALNILLLAGIAFSLSNTIEEQNKRIEQLERYQDSTNASLLKIVAEMNGVGG